MDGNEKIEKSAIMLEIFWSKMVEISMDDKTPSIHPKRLHHVSKSIDVIYIIIESMI